MRDGGAGEAGSGVGPPGLDLIRLGDYLAEADPGLLPGRLSAQLLAGGRSNLTYRVWSDERAGAEGAGAGGSLVLRRPPLGHVLPTAHDMAREHRVLSALHPVGFPVPAPMHLCPDPQVIGAPFYLMSFVDGVVLRTAEDIRDLSPAAARQISEQLVDTLAALHAIDPAAVGLADFGRPEGYLQRQVRRWYEQWTRSATRTLATLDELAGRLSATAPNSSAAAVIHGDFRLDNVIVDRRIERILAVLDWEMATLGDPLADLGLLVVYTELAAEGLAPTQPRMGPEQGFCSAEQLTSRYQSQSTAPVPSIAWYVGFGYFKLAIICEGIHARHLQGKTVGTGFDRMGAAVPLLVSRAQAALVKG